MLVHRYLVEQRREDKESSGPSRTFQKCLEMETCKYLDIGFKGLPKEVLLSRKRWR